MDLNKAIPYDELHSSATQSESSNYVSGKTENGDMFSVIVFALIIIFIILLVIYKIINFIYIRKFIDKIR